ncbi:MAG: UTP--glucose-1-phosphate uridylyltransferase [Clostridia bacterium]|nr:UTP--glucose-1-phosphate uridylyltransferase [Clostridia bacterium]
MNYEDFVQKVTSYGQEHLIKLYERLDDNKKEKLLEQVSNINFDEVNNLYALAKEKKEFSDVEINPVEACDASKLSIEEKERLEKIGIEAIKSGKLAVVMMAGGQGTRLGHSGPKGTYDFGLDSHISIFESFVKQFKEAEEKYGVPVPWYIMTSRENIKDTVEFFQSHNYFNYEEGIRTFFSQNELPMLDEDGKLIVDENGLIKEAANGHGGVFDALVSNGVLSQLKSLGIEWIFICGVDNILAHMVDPLAVGFSIDNGFKCTSVSCIKANPEEKVGVLCIKNGKPSVVEYTELTDELRYAKKENGELLFSEGHLLMNLFNVSVISEIAEKELPYHVAHKKSNIVDEEGNVIKPDAPNAYKFESFIFDAFERLPQIGVLRYKREDCFAPIKNAEGVDSPETARALYKAYHNL